MLPLGHLGIGRRLVAPWAGDSPTWVIYLGTVLPDLIDKPAYYVACAITGRHGSDVGLLSGTRTFGHTLLLTAAVALFGRCFRWRAAKALSLGMISHLVLDTVGDGLGALLGPAAPPFSRPGIVAVVWPLMGLQFPEAQTLTFASYFLHSATWVNIAAEVLGAAFLGMDFVRRANGNSWKQSQPKP